jgi:hypothetical protein
VTYCRTSARKPAAARCNGGVQAAAHWQQAAKCSVPWTHERPCLVPSEPLQPANPPPGIPAAWASSLLAASGLLPPSLPPAALVSAPTCRRAAGELRSPEPAAERAGSAGGGNERQRCWTAGSQAAATMPAGGCSAGSGLLQPSSPPAACGQRAGTPTAAGLTASALAGHPGAQL